MIGMPIVVDPYIRPGSAFAMDGKIVVRHMSEFLLTLAGARWHVNGHCPTWTDATECRCMVEDR